MNPKPEKTFRAISRAWGAAPSVLRVLGVCLVAAAAAAAEVGQWEAFETSFQTARRYANPFTDVEVNVTFTHGGRQWVVPAFWAGGGKWTVRFAPPAQGEYQYRVQCTDPSNRDLNGAGQSLSVTAYPGDNPLLKHGFLRVSADRRHFEHADGTAFFWLGDTWWKGLCKRMTWQGFRELTADRKAKGFSVVQIVAGPYPDQPPFDPRWENEAGLPYDQDYAQVRPAYFDLADHRIRHLVEAGIVPAIVGGWGWHMPSAGVEKMKRHWRYLIARYGAYPVVWIIGGEAGGPQWTEVAKYVRQADPGPHLVTLHPIDSARKSVTDETVIDFDMLQTGHGDWSAALGAVPKIRAAFARTPAMPVLVGEACYEQHMQTAFQDVQRYVFWGCLLSGEAGHTYGAAGVWHAGVEGDPGTSPVYDFTTWREGMNFPGSTQLGLGKKLLEQYSWWRFQPHPEWAEPDCFAAGMPGEVRFIYQPRRGVYDWNGSLVKHLDRNVPYRAFYFNPANAKRYDLGAFVCAGPPAKPFEGHTLPLLFSDRFDGAEASAWKDHGTPSHCESGRMVGAKGMLTIVEPISETNLMASVEANSDAEAGIVLRFHAPDHYLVALYTPSLKAIYIHDRQSGNWGEALGQVAVPEIGPKIQLTAAAFGPSAALVLTDGQRTYYTPPVKVANVSSGKTGLWHYQIGESQEYANFQLSRTQPGAVQRETNGQACPVFWSDDYKAPRLPSPQDWVLVLERAKP
jgi:hypothetical protein